MAAVSGPKNDDLFASALQYLRESKFQDFNELRVIERVRIFQCTKDNINYFAKFTAVNLEQLKRWGPKRGELLVCSTTNDPRINKITHRAYITKDGNHTEEASSDIRIAIDVSPFVKGFELFDYIDFNGSLKMDEVLRFAIPLAEQILSLHRSGIVHRDIKSQNILLEDSNGTPRLVDHEFAKFCDTDEPLSPCGTRCYMAPEVTNQFLQNKDLYKLDSFSYGAILVEMITGCSFSEEKMASLAREEKELSIDNSLDRYGCDSVVKDLIKGLLKRNPEERMSMKEALDRLKAHQAQRAAAKNKSDEKE